MPPLSRQQTLDSVLSWWSDSNSPGPTINLHAVAKPLMRLMYHQQVLGFLKRINDTPLSEDILQLFWDYLAYKYLSPLTKQVILLELCRRVNSVEEAQHAVNSAVFGGVAELLKTQNATVRALTCEILGRMAIHESTAMAVLELNPCVQLVSFVRDGHVEAKPAMFALCRISFWPDGAQAVLEAKTLDHVARFLKTPDSDIRKWTCWTVGNIAMHESTAMAVLGLKPCPQLVALLRDESVEVIEGAMNALYCISYWADGAQAALEAKTLDIVAELLESHDPGVRKWTCRMVANLAMHESTAMAVLELRPCLQLVALSQDESVEVIESAMNALYRISYGADGAQAALEAKTLDYVAKFLWAPNSDIRKWTCRIVANLALHESTAMDVLGLKSCPQLVALLRDGNVEVIEGAVHALCQISHRASGAQAALEANTLDSVAQLLESHNPGVRKWTCRMVANLAMHESTAMAVLELRPCLQLVALSRDESVEVIEGAMNALYRISYGADGAQATLEAKTLDHVVELLESPSPGVREWTCRTVANLAMHESIAMAVLGLNPCLQLVGLLQDGNVEVIDGAMHALCQISHRVNGAQAVMEAKTLDLVAKLLESPNPGVCKWTCRTVANLAMHESTAMAVLELNPCLQLVALLQDESIEVIEGAIHALYHISYGADGAQATLEAKTLSHTARLLESPDPRVRQWMCWIMGNLATHESTIMAVMGLKPCRQLVALLQDEDVEVIEGAMYVLCQMSRKADGAQAALEAKTLDHVARLLESPYPGVRRWMCWTVGIFATHGCTIMAVLGLKPCRQLVALLCDEYIGVIEGATYALSRISSTPDGAQAALEAKTLDHVAELLASLSPEFREQTCVMVRNVMSHVSAVGAVLQTGWCRQLVSLLQDTDSGVRDSALFALASISTSTHGVMAVARTSVLEHVSELMDLGDHRVQYETCVLLRNLLHARSPVS